MYVYIYVCYSKSVKPGIKTFRDFVKYLFHSGIWENP